MSRTPLDTEVDQYTDETDVTTMAQAVDYLSAISQTENENAIAVARKVGYDGPLTLGAIEDRIRQSMRRTVEEVLEIGKSLLIMKELSSHGEFSKRAELLGIQPRMAQKFMSSVLKFSNANSNSLLKAAGTQTKMLELLVLDDGEIEALESGETVRGVTLDKIETMSVSELKKALRDANERIEAKDAVIKDKSAKIDQQAETIAALDNRKRTEAMQPVSLDQALINARTNLQNYSANIKAQVMSQLRACVKALHEIPGDHKAFMSGCLVEISREMAILRDEYAIPAEVSEDLTPEWMKPGALDGLEAQYQSAATSAATMTDEEAADLADAGIVVVRHQPKAGE